MSNNTLITAKNIEQTFKLGDSSIQVLHNSSFSLQKNTFNIIYGPSGSGKSTLLNVLSGIQSPSAGKVFYDGIDIYAMSGHERAFFRAKQIGVVYQQNYWVSSLNVIENVSMPLLFLGFSRRAALKLAMDALQRVDMATFSKKDPRLLSGGEQQRIAMARAIVSDPAYIIADEPTGNLDSKNGDMILSLLQSYNTDLHRTIILVTHDMEYLALADQLLHIEDGVCTSMASDDIKKTTDTLMKDMKNRIDKYAKAKHYAK